MTSRQAEIWLMFVGSAIRRGMKSGFKRRVTWNPMYERWESRPTNVEFGRRS